MSSTATAHSATRLSPGHVGMWFFLASEAMLFIGLIGGYLVLRSTSGELFSSMALVLDRNLAIAGTCVLLASSVTMYFATRAARRGEARKTSLHLFLTVLCAAIFIAIGALDYRALWRHQTIVARQSADAPLMAYDGDVQSDDSTIITLTGWRCTVPARGFDIHTVSPWQIRTGIIASEYNSKPPQQQTFQIPSAFISDRTNYFPHKNNFFASFFTLTGVHGAHVMAGAMAILLLAIQSARGKVFANHIENVSLYWHFVDIVWLGLFTMFYLV